MPDIGSTLREARMRARIDISEVEARTKIRAKYLRAIENEEWDLLPGPVYVKSFLKTYGEYLGLDSRLLIDEYRRRYERPSDGEVRPISARTRERERERVARRPTLPPWLIIAVVIVAILVVLDLVGSGGSNSPKSTNPVTGIHAKPTTRHHRSHRRHTTKTRPPVKRRPGSVKLQLTPTAAVYVCVTDAKGKKLIDGITYQPGQTVPTVRGAKLLVNLGNNGVDMRVDGVPVGLTASSSAIDFALTPTSKSPQPLPAGQTPNCG